MEQSTWCGLCCASVLCCFGGVTHSQSELREAQRGSHRTDFSFPAPFTSLILSQISTSDSAENRDRNSNSSFISNPDLKTQTTGLWSQTPSCQVLSMDFVSLTVQLQQKEQSDSSVPALLGTAGGGWWLQSCLWLWSDMCKGEAEH